MESEAIYKLWLPRLAKFLTVCKADISHFALIRVVVCAEKHGRRGREGFQVQKTNIG